MVVQKKIRHWIYRDYYLTNETEEEMNEWPAHIGEYHTCPVSRILGSTLMEVDHCVEMLRQAIICKADPSLATFEWLPGNPPHLTGVAKGHHQCVAWDNLQDWVRARAAPIFEPGVLVGPN